MISISRCEEPDNLPTIRSTELAHLRSLGHPPTSDDIRGYGAVGATLWGMQHHKCCYCERRVPKSFNDVEHYRPKAYANREPGSADTHGYWWLAFTWGNLLFACPSCNRSSKNSRFPLANGSTALTAEAPPPGQEIPLLIDPSSTTNPVEHIEFVRDAPAKASIPAYWRARPRQNSLFGSITIEVCGLNRHDLLEIREDYYATIVKPQAEVLNRAIQSQDASRSTEEFYRAMALLSPRNCFVGLTYDALRALVPDASIRPLIGTAWPTPREIAQPPRA